MEAVAGYIKGLREEQGITQTQVAATVGQRLNRDVQSTTIWRIENAKTVPGGDMLIVLLDLLGGSINDLARLLSSDQTAEDGRAAAAAWLSAAAEQATPEHRQVVAEELRQLADRLEAGDIPVPRRGSH